MSVYVYLQSNFITIQASTTQFSAKHYTTVWFQFSRINSVLWIYLQIARLEICICSWYGVVSRLSNVYHENILGSHHCNRELGSGLQVRPFEPPPSGGWHIRSNGWGSHHRLPSVRHRCCGTSGTSGPVNVLAGHSNQNFCTHSNQSVINPLAPHAFWFS